MGTDKRGTNVYILSDSLGETADQVAKAALSQFESGAFDVVRMPRISTASQLEDALKSACTERCVMFYTFADPHLRSEMERLSEIYEARTVDILGPAVIALALTAEQSPAWKPGMIRRVDRGYFRKIEALEYAVNHDDGRHPEGLRQAQIILIGVSRTSKTPLSMFLAYQGYRTANVPLVAEVDPPRQLFEVDPKIVFGLTTDPDFLVEIRSKRVSDLGAYARRYADREFVQLELAYAREIMSRIGCIVINTYQKAIEQTAHEILRWLNV